jgi:hypothetical protein
MYPKEELAQPVGNAKIRGECEVKRWFKPVTLSRTTGRTRMFDRDTKRLVAAVPAAAVAFAALAFAALVQD